MKEKNTDYEKATRLLDDLLENGNTLEKALSVLRNNGFSYEESRVAIETILKVSKENACEMLCASETWKDAGEYLNALKLGFFDAIEEDAENVNTDKKGNTQVNIDLTKYRKEKKNNQP